MYAVLDIRIVSTHKMCNHHFPAKALGEITARSQAHQYILIQSMNTTMQFYIWHSQV